MDIIETNGDAESRHDAIIKELHFVRVPQRTGTRRRFRLSVKRSKARGKAAAGMPGGGGAWQLVHQAGGGMPPGGGCRQGPVAARHPCRECPELKGRQAR
jgi:hypothetical protein